MLLQNDVFDYYFRIGRIASEVKHQFRLGDVYSLGIASLVPQSGQSGVLPSARETAGLPW